MSHPPPLLHVNELTVIRSQKTIVSNVSLTLQSGDFWSIIGPNGVGKTTLLRTILGLNPPSSGTITLQGRPLSQFSAKEKARQMAYVPQSHDPGEYARVREFVRMGRYPYLGPLEVPNAQDEMVVDMALRQTDTLPLANRLMHTLSGGECQKVMIAAALAQQPKLLFLDEPATFLDPRNQCEIQALLRLINRTLGTTVVAITHDLNSVLHGSSRVIALKQGAVFFEDSPQVAMTPERLSALFDMPFHCLRDAHNRARWIVPDLSPDADGLACV